MAHQAKKETSDFSLSRQINLKNNIMLVQNEELIQKLNKKIDRRLNIGYYCEVQANRKQRNYQTRKIFIAKGANEKRKYPIIKRKKKDQKPGYVDCEQNTDQLQFADDFQNTSRVYTEKKEEPEHEDNEAQWNYQVEKVNQSQQCNVDVADGSMQYDQFIEVQDASIQYQDPGGILELKEVSIQYEDLEPKQQIPEIVVENRQAQCDEIDKLQKGLQFDEIKPKLQEQNIQIDLPDLKNLQKLQNLEQKLEKTQREKLKQAKINKAFKSRMQVLKLKEEINNMQKQIEMAEINEKRQQEKRERQQEINNQKKLFSQLRRKDLTAINKHFQNRLSKIIHRVKSKQKINPTQSKNLNMSIVSNIQQNKQQTKQKHLQEIQKLHNDLKQQMKKRMRYQQDFQETEDSKMNSYGQLGKVQSNIEIANLKMRNLFPNPECVDRCFAGTIIKNISGSFSPNKLQNSEKRDYRIAKIARAFCQRRSEVISDLKKNKERQQVQKIKATNLGNSFTAEIKNIRNSSLNFYTKERKPMQSMKTERYTIRRYKRALKVQEMKALSKMIKNLFESEIVLKYLYKEQQKMQLGNQLFQIFSPQQRVKRPIDIFKFKDYLVYSYLQRQATRFVIFYHSLKYLFYGEQQSNVTNQIQFYSNPIFYKNDWGIEYYSSNNNYNGEYRNGQKHGFGLQITHKNAYEGYFQNGNKIGKGKNIFQNGDIYQGDFKENLAHGQGIYKWQNGQQYEGFFQKGKRQGFGKHSYPNGDLFEGFYANNLKEGKGRYRWSDGTVYQGHFKNDLKCGQGKLTNSDESYFIGIWNNDVCSYVCRKIAAKMAKNGESKDSRIKM